ncbi:hypothetical protein ACOMHN_013135 [Nucella lapillus]
MKTSVAAGNVGLMTSPAALAASEPLKDTIPMELEEGEEDKDLPRLPPIHPPTTKPHGIRRTSSARFQYPAQSAQMNQAGSGRARSLLDIHEESMDSDAPPSSTSTTSEITTSVDQTSKSHAPSVSGVQGKLLERRRENGQKQNYPSPSSKNGQIQSYPSPNFIPPRYSYLRHADGHTALPNNRHRRRLKSLSQRDVFEEERDTAGLPHLYPDRVPHPTELRTRSMSVTSFLPRPLPSLGTSRSKSSSQPDISRRTSCLMTPLGHSACDLTESRKERVQRLWQRAGQVLRSPRDRVEVEEAVSWVESPGGGLLRPDYSRWPQRRHALAEPERMVMTQPVKERILKDVEIRKRSMKRRVSQYLTIKLNLNIEEDLVT